MSFITQFKIEFLLPFTGCRKVLRKMLADPMLITASFTSSALILPGAL